MTKTRFKKAYIVYMLVLLVLAAAAMIYIWSLLSGYEASQPERAAEKQITRLQKSAEEGKLSELLDFSAYRPENDDIRQRELAAYTDKVRGGKLVCELASGFEAEGQLYNIKYGGETLARLTLRSTEVKTKLIVFNFEKWEVVSLEPAIIDKSFELPASLKLEINGNAVAGKDSGTAGMLSYNISSLTTPEIKISDVSGGTVIYDPRKAATTYGYSVEIPSDYKLFADGKEVPADTAASSVYPQFQYVSEYTDCMPKRLTYDLYFLSNNVDFKVTDSTGAEVPFEKSNRKITIDFKKSGGAMPDDLKSEIDVLEVAHMWSLFMTQDLGGANNGYGKIQPYLIPDSGLQRDAWKWATGIDITFTSIHTLGNPPFTDDAVTNYVRYGDDCFSCTVTFTKHMHLNDGQYKKDPMDSTFYFVRYDDTNDNRDNPRWMIADMRENVKEG